VYLSNTSLNVYVYTNLLCHISHSVIVELVDSSCSALQIMHLAEATEWCWVLTAGDECSHYWNVGADSSYTRIYIRSFSPIPWCKFLCYSSGFL